jgi:hypothetical protein
VELGCGIGVGDISLSAQKTATPRAVIRVEPNVYVQNSNGGNMDRRACIEALKQLGNSDDTNRDQVVRKCVKDFIKPAASDLHKQLRALSEDIDAEAGTVADEHWSYAKVFVQSMLHYMDAEMVDPPESNRTE